MRAAVVSELGRPPRPGEVADPTEGDADVLVEIEAAPLNPIDLAVAAGRNPAGHPPLPFVPGCEGIGTADGRRVWVYREGIGIARNGCMAERVAAPNKAITPVPDNADPAVAAAMGIAGMAGWASLSWRVPVREDDVVLVLGATGTVGNVAVQAADPRRSSGRRGRPRPGGTRAARRRCQSAARRGSRQGVSRGMRRGPYPDLRPALGRACGGRRRGGQAGCPDRAARPV